MAKDAEITGARLLNLVDLAGQLYLRRFNALVGPVALAEYTKAYTAARGGEVPMQVIYALAEQHSDRMGTYFNESSKEALSQGFNTFVNQKLPTRVAASRALDAYGMTPRTDVWVHLTAPGGEGGHSQPASLKAKALDYIGRSIRETVKDLRHPGGAQPGHAGQADRLDVDAEPGHRGRRCGEGVSPPRTNGCACCVARCTGSGSGSTTSSPSLMVLRSGCLVCTSTAGARSGSWSRCWSRRR